MTDIFRSSPSGQKPISQLNTAPKLNQITNCIIPIVVPLRFLYRQLLIHLTLLQIVSLTNPILKHVGVTYHRYQSVNLIYDFLGALLLVCRLLRQVRFLWRSHRVVLCCRSDCIRLWVAAVSYLLPQVRFERLLFRIFFHMYVSSDFCFTLLGLLVTVDSIHLICMTKSLMYSVCKFAY
ncbi:hypothetical protein HanHA89_Chr16g0641361 [Helianthus annuus]|nr:hypothetical protein HanHA89_Chr16g0641361 [Helianthus annuus]